MTVCIDTGVLYADHDLDASRHDAASRALEAVFDGEFGHPYVSDYIYDEAVTLKRGQAFTPAQQIGEKIRGVDPYPQIYELLRVSAAVFADAVEMFEQYDDQALRFTDATTVALCRRHNIDAVMSFDDDFDGIVERIDPTTV
ncbi:PIN domain-containing protein [Natronorubrum sp. JWXQ-INN-674]|uniref:PIN domain-containing protein n=1 Tax=Natronorubrum halalkaliphilum TaxID=2691917 RepID=A0A6B0VHD9_9EURY|nr:type II toxin-antitoxin system VapC family toxin [Natronorubrum halalkaliphilum]MXV60960.1 PIN domain-containing protein [Natronorubrum halalkaliphilum]